MTVHTDSFDRTNAATLGAVPNTGLVYEYYGVSGFEIVGGTAKKLTPTLQASQAVVNTGTTNAEVTVQVVGTSYMGVVGRFVDTNNHILVQALVGGYAILYQKIGGVFTTLASPSNVFTSGDRLGLRVVGTTAVVLLNGAIIGTGSLTGAGALANATRWGLNGYAIGDRFDDLAIDDLFVPVVVSYGNTVRAPDPLVWERPNGAGDITLVPFNPSRRLFREIGTTGRYMPPFSFIERDAVHGSSLRRVKVGAREVSIPLTVQSEQDAINVRTVMRSLSQWLNPLNGNGIGALRYTAPDGVIRKLYCVYAGGLDVAEDGRGTFIRSLLVFRAFDPFWYAGTADVFNFAGGTAIGFFPIFPMNLSQSQIFGNVAAVNDGDVEAWPIWYITGPANAPIILRNLGTGNLISLNISLMAGEGLTIDTRPGSKSVIKTDGSNLYSALSTNSYLWPIPPGESNLSIEMAGTTLNSLASLQFTKRYLAP